MSRIFSILILCLGICSCEGQNKTSTSPLAPKNGASKPKTYFQDTLYHKYADVIDTSAINIHFASELRPFFKQLQSLQKGTRKKIRISHIGDSHIQADYLTGQLRRHFQQDFGNGGRGLIFPYQLANTNGPNDYQILSNTQFEAKRNVFPEISMDIGVSGISIRAKSCEYQLQIQIDSSDRADSLVIFHKGPPKNPFSIYSGLDDVFPVIHKVKPGETLVAIAKKYKVSKEKIKFWNELKSNQIRAGSILTIFPIKEVPKHAQDKKKLRPIKKKWRYDSTHIQLHLEKSRDQLVLKYRGPIGHEINGIYFENDQQGLIYNMIGVNGAKYKHYNQSVNFQKQFQKLNSNLILISLGTNEILENNYEGESLESEFSLFITELKRHNPTAQVLICLPPDIYGRTNKKINAIKINKTLKDLCQHQEIAYFDFFKLMGGKGSMYRWYQKGLANKDLVHLNRPGYELLGDLFYTALIRHFLEYQQDVGVN